MVFVPTTCNVCINWKVASGIVELNPLLLLVIYARNLMVKIGYCSQNNLYEFASLQQCFAQWLSCKFI